MYENGRPAAARMAISVGMGGSTVRSVRSTADCGLYGGVAGKICGNGMSEDGLGTLFRNCLCGGVPECGDRSCRYGRCKAQKA